MSAITAGPDIAVSDLITAEASTELADAPKRRGIVFWVVRYLPAEIVGTAAMVMAGLAVTIWTDAPALIAIAALIGESGDHVGVREGLDRVVEVHERQSRGEALVLAAHALGVQQQHGSAVQGDRGLSDVGGEQRRGLVAADVADRARGARVAPRGCARGGGDGYGGDADGGGCGHDSCSRERRPSRRPVLAVIVNAPAAMA